MTKKISQLNAAAALTGLELVELEQSGGSVRTTTQAIADLGGGSFDPTDYTGQVHLKSPDTDSYFDFYSDHGGELFLDGNGAFFADMFADGISAFMDVAVEGGPAIQMTAQGTRCSLDFINNNPTNVLALTGEARMYIIDNGAGKMRLMVVFPSGSPVQLAIEP